MAPMLKLLVVDDSELIRSRLVELLQGIPSLDPIDTAGTLTQTLNQVEHGHPELVILDLHLPDGDTLNILPVLKRMAPDMRIAMLTNDASHFNRDKCLNAGASWFFDKSTEFEKVLDLVQQQVALH